MAAPKKPRPVHCAKYPKGSRQERGGREPPAFRNAAASGRHYAGVIGFEHFKD
jgi:hypothetical protein